MSRNNESNSILEKYFSKNKRDKIVTVSNETGISISTISRYVKQHGYANYADFRNSELKLINPREDILPYIKGKKVYISSSRSCNAVGWFFYEKLREFGYIVTHLSKSHEHHSRDGVALFFTLTGNSRAMGQFDKNQVNKVYISPSLFKEENFIKANFHYRGSTRETKYKSVINFIKWVDEQKI